MTRFVYLHRKLLPTLAGLVLLLLGGLLAGEDKLASRVEEFLAQPHFKTAHWGYLFVDLTSGEVVLERNPEKLFVPACLAQSCVGMADFREFPAIGFD